MRSGVRLLSFILAAVLLIRPVAVQADDGVTYSPAPGYAGSTELFGACGFQTGEPVTFFFDDAAQAQVVADGGCAHLTRTTPLTIAPTTHLVRMVGGQSGTEQTGVYVVAPPMAIASPAVPGGTATVTGQFFAPGRTPLLIPADGHLLAAPAVTDANGGLIAQVTVLPNTPPGAYPVLIRDDPWLTNPPPLVIVVAAPQPSAGNWTLTATSTLTRESGALSAHGTSTLTAPFTVAGGMVQGQGVLAIGLAMSVSGASCHGESQVPFAVGGTDDGDTFHLTLSGVGAAAPLTVTCDNGLTLPFALPGGAAAEPFDIAAVDGTTIDLDTPGGSSNPFVDVPAGFSGYTHVVLAAN